MSRTRTLSSSPVLSVLHAPHVKDRDLREKWEKYKMLISIISLSPPSPSSSPSSKMTTSPGEISSPPRAHLLKRVLSHSSSGTPGPGAGPSSPQSGGRTPKARKAVLRSSPAPGDIGRKGSADAGLSKDLEEQLNVYSPQPIHSALPVDLAESSGMSAPDSTYAGGGGEGVGGGITARGQKPPNRSFSTSTESSSSASGGHPIPPSQLGSVYGAEGFAETLPQSMTPDQVAAIAAADEAVKQLNGTSTVYGNTGPTVSGAARSGDYGYALPRTFANFVKPQAREMRTPGEHSITRQSSTSSSTTEASTSSEESDLCIPTIEWVQRDPAVASPFGWNNPYLPQNNSPRHRGSPRVLPASPRKSNGSVLPPGLPLDAPDDDDDEATVGNGRDRSSSTSSQSAQSGLDLLWRAVNQPPPSKDESKGKRKAGADAVAQWRTSGIPNGPSKTKGEERVVEPPKKRRRSDMKMEEVDPALREESSNEWAMDDGSDYSGSDEGEQSAGSDGEYGGAAGARGRRVSRGKKKGTTRGRVSSASGQKPAVPKKKKQTEDSPSGKARRGSVAAPGNGTVRCEYINPLPPYNRCQDVFTRRYDLPRHMARHARREGEMVVEGTLAADKATLWNTIKDKPKVECQVCHETFTRMDALKRHQAKQHH